MSWPDGLGPLELCARLLHWNEKAAETLEWIALHERVREKWREQAKRGIEDVALDLRVARALDAVRELECAARGREPPKDPNEARDPRDEWLDRVERLAKVIAEPLIAEPLP